MIDEQKLLDDMKLNCRICGGVLSEGAILAIIRRQPTVDAVPVVHGTYTESEENEEWYGKEYQCNSCETECMVSNANGFELSPKICPICGVRFDGKEE